jgi:two-component system sensor histidine kinase KdpD
VTEVEGHVVKHRGRHKVFLGYAAGVGKTYEMLDEAHRRAARGEDVVIGYVEPHKRPATAKLEEGLEKLPTAKIDYRGKEFQELDLSAVLSRRPQIVLIDELAHTNVPGAGDEKRWQSVVKILDAGINVMSTVNVQHLESLNDTIFEITGVRVRETVPDRVVEEADEVVLVDITPEALLNRLDRGVIYAPEKVERARHGFFKKGNLVALRELALRTTAEEIDADLLAYVDQRGIGGPWPARDRVLVCITPQPMAQALLRRGYRLTQRLGGKLWCLYVRPAGHALTREEQGWLRDARALAATFGAQFSEMDAESAAQGIVDFAAEHHVTQVVLGQSARSRWEEVVKGSVVNRIMRETTGLDVLIVADLARARGNGPITEDPGEG